MPAHTDIEHARQFVRSAKLPPAPPRLRGAGEGETPDEALQAGKAQAAVVGSDVVSFATNVAPQWRQDLINCSLFAQLWAKAEVADPTRIFDWYGAYFGALQQLGWMVQDQGFAVYVETSQNFSAHEAILKVAEGLLMPAAGSLALVKTTLTQVLFFKSLSSQATLRHCSGKVSVNTPLLEALRPDLGEQLKEHARSFVRKLPSKLLQARPAG